MNDQTLAVVRELRQDDVTKDSAQAKLGAQNGLAHLDAAAKEAEGGGGMQQLGAVKEYLRSVSGKVVTDKELDGFLNSTGKFNNWESAIDQYIKGGERPEEFLRQLRGLLSTIRDRAQTNLDATGSKAYEIIKRQTGDETQADVGRGFFTGNFSTPSEKPQRYGKNPGTSGESSADRRKRITEGL